MVWGNLTISQDVILLYENTPSDRKSVVQKKIILAKILKESKGGLILAVFDLFYADFPLACLLSFVVFFFLLVGRNLTACGFYL